MLTMVAALLGAFVSMQVCHGAQNRLLIVSFDGFRWDYLSKTQTPSFYELASTGAHVMRMKNVFPTVTFPNHWSLVTGRYSENHGIIANSMYDPVYNDTFTMSTTDEKWWNTTEPIWVTAMRHNLTAATYFWPGSEASINGFRPKHFFKYSESVPYKERVDTVMDWLKNESVDLATLYISEPDSAGHTYGPDAPATKRMIQDMDSMLGYLMNNLKSNGLENKVNLIVTSDHGMAAVNLSRTIVLTQYVNASDIQWYYAGAIGLLLPKEGLVDKVYNSLRGAHPHMTVYLKADIPDDFHYKNNRRIPPIVIIADEGWLLTKTAPTNPLAIIGSHGYSNALPSMRPLLLARGPDFKRGFVKDEIETVDVYPLMCKILGIEPHEHDGNLARVSDLLADKPVSSSVDLTAHTCMSILTTSVTLKALHRMLVWV